MGALERFSTSGMRPRQRVEFWNEWCSSRTPVAAQPLDLETFEPSCTRSETGSLLLAEFCSSPSIVDHTTAHVSRTREPGYFLCFQIEGASVHRQGGREAHLQCGDFTLLNSMEPYQMIFEAANKMLLVAFSEAPLLRQIPSPRSVSAIRMGYEDALAKMLYDFAVGLWRTCADPGLEGVESQLSSALLNLIGCAYTPLSRGTPRRSVALENRRFQVLAYIENHLRDGDLSPATIAARFKSSSRSVHMLFANEPETLSRYILRRRLEESARALASPLQAARTISDIAFDHGFSSSAHFCKVFRDHFDATPSEYRQHRGASAQQCGAEERITARESCTDDERPLRSR